MTKLKNAAIYKLIDRMKKDLDDSLNLLNTFRSGLDRCLSDYLKREKSVTKDSCIYKEYERRCNKSYIYAEWIYKKDELYLGILLDRYIDLVLTDVISLKFALKMATKDTLIKHSFSPSVQLECFSVQDVVDWANLDLTKFDAPKTETKG